MVISKRVWQLLLLLVVTLALAVGGAVVAQDDAHERPTDRLEQITVLPAEAIADPAAFVVRDFTAAGTGAISLQTDIPVACQVVYGPTLDFGSLVFDANMASFAVIDHNPILTGLESNTLYYYRLQGFDENGQMYLSEILTFETPDFEAMAAANVNLAAADNGATVTNFSSAFGGAALGERWGADSAFDGNPGTAWSSAGDGDTAWVEVQLAGPARIDGVEFWSRQMSDGTSITRAFTITTETGEVFGPFEVSTPDESIAFDVEIVAETLRFDLIETTGGNTGAVDIAVYGEFVE